MDGPPSYSPAYLEFALKLKRSSFGSEGDRPHEVGLFGEKCRGVFSVEQQGYRLGQRGQAVGGKCGKIRFGDKA